VNEKEKKKKKKKKKDRRSERSVEAEGALGAFFKEKKREGNRTGRKTLIIFVHCGRSSRLPLSAGR